MKSRTPARARQKFGLGIRYALFGTANARLKSQKFGEAVAAGYTIIEVIIVMAVTGALFAGVVLMFNGKQATIEFTQAVRDYEAQIQAVASDVATGTYSTGTFNCMASGPSVSFSVGANLSGTNLGCIFLGKIITTADNNADIFTLAGRQYKFVDNVTDVENLAEAGPKVVGAPVVDLTENYVHKFGLLIKNVYTIPSNFSVGGFGFISELSGATGAGNPDTGSRGVLLYQLNGTSSPNTNNRTSNSNLINTTSNLVAASGGIRICFTDGGSRRGEITVGENGSQTATELTIDNGVSTLCQ